MMRVPEKFYFDHGYVEFMRSHDQILYEIWKYSEDGFTLGKVEEGEVRDEQHLKELQSLGSVKT